MQRSYKNLRRAAVLAMAVVCFETGNGLFAEPAPTDKSTEADVSSLVRQALGYEVEGQSQRRTALIEEALQRQPDYAPARWHGGYVRVDDQWMTPDQASQHAGRDPRHARYRKRRDALSGTVQDQMTLARWCRKNGLDAEALAHWTQVIQSQPDHKEALKSLGVQWSRGMLVTHEEARQYKQQLKDANRAMDHWRPILTKWRRTIRRGNTNERQHALQELRRVTDPAAVPALERVLSVPSSSEDGPTLSLELVAMLGEMPGPEATESLVRHVVHSPWQAVRAAAADRLKQRPLRSYVPLLMSGMTSPLESSFQIQAFPNGTVAYFHRVFREGALADTSILRSAITFANPRGVTTPTRVRMLADRAVAQGTGRAVRRAVEIQRAVAAENMRAIQRNERIYSALTQTTDVQVAAEPQQWWQWWAEYNEVYYPKAKPVRHFVTTELFPITSSCFARGTSVWTLAGPVPIESVRVGDRVLAQDVDMGELAYKPVVGTTVRPPGKMLRFVFGQDEVVATLGHPFWVVGQGWRMAKHLKTGDRIHSVGGSATLDRIEQAPTDEAYNLVVADFGDYFAGDTRVLVHDYTARELTGAPVPGLPPD